jgi:DNA ligase D-like protein (predicted 3'-phosphoesterase)
MGVTTELETTRSRVASAEAPVPEAERAETLDELARSLPGGTQTLGELAEAAGRGQGFTELDSELREAGANAAAPRHRALAPADIDARGTVRVVIELARTRASQSPSPDVRTSIDSVAGDDGLSDYRAKRDSRRSPEPAGEIRPHRNDGEPIFVVHPHMARPEHYDFRLEVDGVLKSWAAPKGPSTDPREKRLAIRVEDHPLDYAEFDGVIPPRQYVAGAVIVWDTGTYRTRTRRNGAEVPIDQALEEGHIVVELAGHKLRGGYALTRTGVDRRGRERWLLVKKRDLAASDAHRDILSTRPESVLSGRTVEQIAAQDR